MLAGILGLFFCVLFSVKRAGHISVSGIYAISAVRHWRNTPGIYTLCHGALFYPREVKSVPHWGQRMRIGALTAGTRSCARQEGQGMKT